MQKFLCINVSQQLLCFYLWMFTRSRVYLVFFLFFKSLPYTVMVLCIGKTQFHTILINRVECNRVFGHFLWHQECVVVIIAVVWMCFFWFEWLLHKHKGSECLFFIHRPWFMSRMGWFGFGFDIFSCSSVWMNLVISDNHVKPSKLNALNKPEFIILPLTVQVRWALLFCAFYYQWLQSFCGNL